MLIFYLHAIQQKDDAILAIRQRTNEGLGFAIPGEFKHFIEPYIRRTMERWSKPNWETCDIPYTDKAIYDLYRELCAGKVYAGDQQNLARFARRACLGQGVARAALTYAATCGDDLKLSPYSKTAVKLGCTSSQDAFTCVTHDAIGTKKKIRCDIVMYRDQKHGFFNSRRNLFDTTKRVENFLRDLNLISNDLGTHDLSEKL